jgi:homoserine O-acetyltransferase
MIAMCTYRSKASFDFKFSRRRQNNHKELFAVESYLRYQGAKLVKRFDANSYIILSRSMDSHDISRGRGGDIHRTLSEIHQPALVVSITSDVLYWPVEQEELVEYMPNAECTVLDSPHGHDAFLIDMDYLNEQILNFMRRVSESKKTFLNQE